VASAQTAAEQVEHYWAALLRDVPFAEYPTNALVAQAVADMNKLSFPNSVANREFPFPVTPQNLFRGQFVHGDGNVQGPYVSQFMLQATSFGAQPLSQQYQTFLPAGGGGTDFMTSVNEYQLIQNGGDSGRNLALDPVLRFIRNGRDLAAYTGSGANTPGSGMMAGCNGSFRSRHCSRDDISMGRSSSSASAGTRVSN
jgi:hypothetical protein